MNESVNALTMQCQVGSLQAAANPMTGSTLDWSLLSHLCAIIVALLSQRVKRVRMRGGEVARRGHALMLLARLSRNGPVTHTTTLSDTCPRSAT
jgi:hypothetical protein